MDYEITGDLQLSIAPKNLNYYYYDLETILDVMFKTKDGKVVWLSSFAYSEPNFAGDYDEKYDYSINIKTNVIKSKEKYKIMILNGGIFESGSNSYELKEGEYHAGDVINVCALTNELK